MTEPLIILSITDRWQVGRVEEEIFRDALNEREFEIIHHPISFATPVSAVPDDVAASADGLFVLRHLLQEDDIKRFTKLKVVVRTGVGYDNLDRKALAARGIKACNVPDYGITEVADHTLALALSLRHGIVLQHDAQRLPNPKWSTLDGPEGIELAGSLIQRPKGKIWGIVGLGRIGTAVALRAKAFGYSVTFFDPLLSNGSELALGISRVRNVNELFSQSDIVSLHCSHNPSTHRLINAATLPHFKPTAILINTARGELVDLQALESALRDNTLAAAGIDVIESEPPKKPLPGLLKAYREREGWLMGRLVVTPHAAWYSPESLVDMRVKSAETMRDVLFDGLETNVINPESW